MEPIGPRFRTALGIAWGTALPVLLLLVNELCPLLQTSCFGGGAVTRVIASADASLIHYIRVTT
jgi:hypothetical protein